MSSSGTLSAYSFNLQRLIDHACRRAGWQAYQVGAENQKIAQDLVFTLTSEWINAGFPLWTRQYLLLGVQVGSADVVCPQGTVEVLHSYWRILQPYRGAAALTTSADASVLIAGAPNADVTIPGPNPGLVLPFSSATQINTVGVLGGGNSDVTGALQIQASADGVTYATVQTLPSATFSPGKWTYADLNPSVTTPYLRIILPQSGAWTVNQFNIGLPNWQDIENGKLNIDDYYNLSDRAFQSDRPNSYFQDRPVGPPVMKIWPTPNLNAFYNGTVTALARRYIQDPGLLTNSLEVPQRWLEAAIWRLAALINCEFSDIEDSDPQKMIARASIRQQRQQYNEGKAANAEKLAWAEERNVAPIRLLPSLRAYTA